jgi:hypothetical protein
LHHSSSPSWNKCKLIRPSPIRPCLRIHAGRICKVLPFNLLILQGLPRTRALVAECLALLGDLIDCQDSNAEAIGFVADGQLERCIDIAFLLVAADVHQILAWAAVGEAVDEPGVGVEVEDNGFIVREDSSIFSISQAVGMVAVRDELGLLVLLSASGKWEGLP